MDTTRLVRAGGLVLGGLVVLGGIVFFVVTRPTEVPLHGRDLYIRYCASCHGVGGKGDGPASKALRPRPNDLTRLRERYKGQYPIRDVMAAIDGRYPVRAHGDSAMPVWGVVFERETEEQKGRWPRQTTVLQVRLIADYVLSLQE
jgi:mono/diheme cytochrome c family protein